MSGGPDASAAAAKLRAAAGRLGIVLEDDHEPVVAVGLFGPRAARTIGSAERARCCTSWERFDRAYVPLTGNDLDDARERLRLLFADVGAPAYEDLAAHHRLVIDGRWVVSCDRSLWADLTGTRDA